ncbi:MAG: hypothetical protein Q9M30_09175, partial [Mariprofundaceae bacterium]|nr:hypothetical protein [Mariprofundaceae bacterium]
YIGPKASEDEKLMDEYYRQFLGGWVDHLNSSKMSVFVPDVEKLKEEGDYIAVIQNWQHE